jgi:hypothetical protein
MNQMKKLVRILPFMEQEEIKKLAYEIINGEVEGVKLVMLFPFLSNDDLDEIVDLLLEKNDGKALQRAVPFARKATVDKIYKAIQDGKIEGIDETYLFPFLGKDQLKSMFKIFVKEAKNDPKGKVDISILSRRDDEDEEFDIELDDEIDTEVVNEMNKLKEEMKSLKKKLKKYQDE